MSLDKLILYFAWIISIISFWKFIPREKRRNAQVAFMFKQFIACLLGLAVANFGLIEYPVRLFPAVNGSSIIFEFLVYPVICALFNVHYPEKKDKIIKFLYYFILCTVLTVIELILENYTQLIKYIHWTGYFTWSSVLITLYISRLYYRWFFKIP